MPFNEFEYIDYDDRNNVRGPMPRMTGIPPTYGSVRYGNKSNSSGSKNKSGGYKGKYKS